MPDRLSLKKCDKVKGRSESASTGGTAAFPQAWWARKTEENGASPSLTVEQDRPPSTLVLCRSTGRHAQGTPQVTCHLGGAGRKLPPEPWLRMGWRILPSATASDWTGRCVAGVDGWMGGERRMGAQARQRVLSENNNSGGPGSLHL